MRSQRAEKYRNEVRKVNTGINRKNKALAKMNDYRQALKTIQGWAEASLMYGDSIESWMLAIAKKCKRVLR